MLRSTASTVLVGVLLVAGCAAGPPGPSRTTTPTPPPAVTPTSTEPPAVDLAPTRPPATVAPAPTGPFSPTDIAWLQLTAAMAERLLPVLELVPARTTDPGWRHLAAQVEATERADLHRALRLLDDAGAPTTNPHEGHDMPGMVTAEQVTALRAATGTPFHRLLAGHLRAHLTQAARVAVAEQRAGAHPAATAMAQAVVRDGNAHLARLDRLDPTTSAGAPATATAR
ncbi:DUF305 domain-containing protein [Micromonospora sp. WMMD1155]|uniref:DUF305 domain-containing protein n=1 Tax=Micromonospora sp. WMMD1155 TaxID=3016094 RepID=UPI00249A06E5|nr:DUF305 domain-containing protein [Micromonospora sp. WMMD1155]WFE53585.1 DUF305 domain-containing protein [Micromonospora sp. WMMD1155]